MSLCLATLAFMSLVVFYYCRQVKLVYFSIFKSTVLVSFLGGGGEGEGGGGGGGGLEGVGNSLFRDFLGILIIISVSHTYKLIAV